MTVASSNPEYCRLVDALGPSLLFYGGPEGRRGVEVHDPNTVAERYRDVFDGDDMDGFFPIGVNNDTLEIYAFDTRRAEPNFSPFWHDSNPEDWRDTADELGTWTALTEYLGRLVADVGMTTI